MAIKKTSRRIRSLGIAPVALIERKIYVIREQRVMLSVHLAELYEVEPRVLIQAVKRNIERFPKDFIFQLRKAESENLKSQSVISSWGGSRATPYAFTQEGVAMLSAVLRSDRAIQVNIAIMRAFVQMREMLTTHKKLLEKVNAMEKKYDEQFHAVFTAIRKLVEPPLVPKRRIGFHVPKA